MTRAATWQHAAPRYESVWSPVTGLFGASLLDSVRAVGGMKLLDLACGPGVVAARAQARGCSVVGVDYSSSMARLARRRLGRAVVAAGDAERPPLAPDSFDGVTINFGLHHFESPARALAQAGRIVRRGCRVGYTVWAAADENPALEAIDRVFAAIAPPEPRPDFPFGDADRFGGSLREVGYDDASMELVRVTRHWRPRRPEDVFQAELEGGGRKTELLERQSAATRDEIRSGVVEVVRRFQGAEGIAIPMTAYVVSATPGEGLAGATG